MLVSWVDSLVGGFFSWSSDLGGSSSCLKVSILGGGGGVLGGVGVDGLARDFSVGGFRLV